MWRNFIPLGTHRAFGNYPVALNIFVASTKFLRYKFSQDSPSAIVGRSDAKGGSIGEDLA